MDQSGQMAGVHNIDFSLVIPLFNEEENVAPLFAAITNALKDCRGSYEVVLVDDGSRDMTFVRAAALADIDDRIRVVAFRRNYGQTAAMAAGIHEARGRVIITMDGDLQNDPTDIPKFLELIAEGYDIVVGWRKKRQDHGPRVFVSKIANRIMASILGIAVKDSGCSLKAYRAELIQSLPLYSEMHRFIPALSQLAGAKLAQIEVKHHPRKFGASKYGFSRIYKVFLDIISIRALLSFARRPLHWHNTMTLISGAIGVFLVTRALSTGRGVAIIIDASTGILFLSLAVFLIAWSLVGQLFVWNDRGIARFATLAADLSSRVASQQKDV
jgi:glycosyltransferase involved in cell wall biosynthesis